MSKDRLAALVLAAGSLITVHSAWAADWTLDQAHSHIAFSGVQVGTPFRGEFGHFSGTISFDPAHPETAHVLITIDTASAKTNDTQRDEAMPQEDWFNVAQYPHATFEATGFQSKGGNAWQTSGTLAIRDSKQPVALPFTLMTNGNTAHAKAHVDLVRTNFGVGQGSWASGQWVALNVGVDIDLVATEKP